MPWHALLQWSRHLPLFHAERSLVAVVRILAVTIEPENIDFGSPLRQGDPLGRIGRRHCARRRVQTPRQVPKKTASLFLFLLLLPPTCAVLAGAR